MNFPNVYYHEDDIKKINSIEISIFIAYQREHKSFETFDSQVIFLYINQTSLTEAINYYGYTKIMHDAIFNCKEITRPLRSSREYWTGWNAEVKAVSKCTKFELELYYFEQEERWQDSSAELASKRYLQYLNILNDASSINNLLTTRLKNDK